MFNKKLSAIIFSAALIFHNATFAAESTFMNLDRAIELALKNNPAITQSSEDQESARWNLSAVRRQHGLSLSWRSIFNYIGGKNYRPNQDYYAQYHFYYNEDWFNREEIPPYHSESTNYFTLSFPVYTGGRLENQIERAEYGLNSADVNTEYVRQNVKYQATEAYYRVLQYDDAIKVQQEAVNFLQSHLDMQNIQYEVGTIAKADVLSTEVQLANYRQQLNSAWGEYETAVATLNNVIGLPVDTVLVTDDYLDDEPYALPEEECIEYALEHRPDGISAAYAVKQAETNIDITKAGYRPTITANVVGQLNGEKPFQTNHGNSEYWQIGLEMQWNIFDNHITDAQLNQAKANYRKAESQMLQQLDQIRLEVHNAYIAMTTAEKNVDIAAHSVSEAEAAYAIAQVRYVEGVDTNLNVMDAQTKLAQAKNNYFNALYTYNVSRAKLEQVMGVPVHTDVIRYVAAVDEGKNSKEALKESELNSKETLTEPELNSKENLTESELNSKETLTEPEIIFKEILTES